MLFRSGLRPRSCLLVSESHGNEFISELSLLIKSGILFFSPHLLLAFRANVNSVAALPLYGGGLLFFRWDVLKGIIISARCNAEEKSCVEARKITDCAVRALRAV